MEVLSVLFSIALLAGSTTAGLLPYATLVQDCHCGFRDAANQEVYTDAIVVYFNETNAIDHRIFKILEYDHKVEKGWNTIYRQGSKASNFIISNAGSLPWQNKIDGTQPALEMVVDPSTQQHLVVGADLVTVRKDMLYGTFQMSLRSAQPWSGGSALTAAVVYNSSQSLELSLLNMNNASDAYVSQLINGEAPSYALGTNYTTLARGSSKLPKLQPWDFMNTRIDWKPKEVSFWVGSNRTRVATQQDRTLPTVPQYLSFRHWSTGDSNFMQGPPVNRSSASVRYVRAFFNSSLMNGEAHRIYDNKCGHVQQCSTTDYSLRGSTAYQEAATHLWKPDNVNSGIRIVAGIVAGCFSTFGVAALLNAFFRRMPWHKLRKLGVVDPVEDPPIKRHSYTDSLGLGRRPTVTDVARPLWRKSIAAARKSVSTLTSALQMTNEHQNQPEQERLLAEGVESSHDNPSDIFLRSYSTDYAWETHPQCTDLFAVPNELRKRSVAFVDSNETLSSPPSYRSVPHDGSSRMEKEKTSVELDDRSSTADHSLFEDPDTYTDHSTGVVFRTAIDYNVADELVQRIHSKHIDPFDQRNSLEHSHLSDSAPDERGWRLTHDAVAAKSTETMPQNVTEAMTTPMVPVKQHVTTPGNPQQRVDHLAGFVAFACLGVTLRHFSLTFWPFVTTGFGNVRHFPADTWLSYVLGPYLLTPFAIGPFFTTSCRFLAARFLKNGKLSDIANKILLRGARMLIPCFIFMVMEYFLLSLGLTGALEYLPSVSYSTWPYVTPQPNFGVFLNEMVELAYIIPNAAPEVVSHYCVGVLWTIPVQHYFSYLVLWGAVVIRDIKRPWKRFAFYGLAITMGWYTSSWSSVHWAGLMIADLDITFNWVAWARAKWYRSTAIISTAFAFAVISPLALLFTGAVYDWSFMSYEAAIHPDPLTGNPLIEIGGPTYPKYYAPSLAVLVFSISLQIIVEVSTVVQWFLSLKVFTILHPHIMTIYLMHGFVFWSLGAWVAISLAERSIPYWANLLIVALVCYTTIFLASLVVSPLIEFVTQSTMKNIWRLATEEPVPHRDTTAPFTKELVTERTPAV